MPPEIQSFVAFYSFPYEKFAIQNVRCKLNYQIYFVRTNHSDFMFPVVFFSTICDGGVCVVSCCKLAILIEVKYTHVRLICLPSGGGRLFVCCVLDIKSFLSSLENHKLKYIFKS